MKHRALAILLPAFIAAWLSIPTTAQAGFPSKDPKGKAAPVAGVEARGIPVGKGRASADGILAKLKNPANANGAANAAALARQNLRVERTFGLVPGLQRLAIRPGAAAQKLNADSIAQTIKELQQTGLYEYVEPDWIVQAQAVPSDAAFTDGSLWGLRNTGQSGGTPGADIDAVNAWDITTGSTEVVVGVIDTGIRHTHQDLAANMWRNPGESGGGKETNGIDDDGNGYIDDVHGINSINGSGNPMDDNDHGTHCAGTIGAVANGGGPHVGVAWNVRLMGLKFLDADGFGATSNAIACVEYAVAKGAKILSNSWGGGGYSQGLFDSIEGARAAGVLFVAAAGNESSNNDINVNFPSNYDLPNVVAVAALDRNDQLAWFTNYGAATVDLGAPGVDIFSSTSESDTSYKFFSGTSMATPHVAGAAALLAAARPNATYLELKQRLMNAARPVSSLAGISVTGATLDAHASLTHIDRFANGSYEDGLNFWTTTGNLTYSLEGIFPGTDGDRCAVFNNGQRPPNGVLTQQFTTNVGETYTLDFNVGVYAFNTQQQRLNVTVESGGATLLDNTTTVTGGGGGTTRWTSRQFQFTASSSVTTIRFTDVSTATDSLDLLLDNVKVVGQRWNLNVEDDPAYVFTSTTVSPPDLNGQSSGLAPIQFQYENGRTVSLTAIADDDNPTTYVFFSHWLKNGVFETTSEVVNVVMTADTTLTPVFWTYELSPPSITSPLSAVAIQGLPFEYRISASEFAHSFSTSALPPGLSLSGDLISGIPTVPGDYAVELFAVNDVYQGSATLALAVRPEPDDHLTEIFTNLNDTNGQSFTFVPDGSSNHYRVLRKNVTAFPTDPSGGQPLFLGDDSFAEVGFQNAQGFAFFGKSYYSCFIGSNGYVTFGSGDSDYSESFSDHFSLPRIAALFDDLNPTTGGLISWKQSESRMTVTFENVPEYGVPGSGNSFQIEMFSDGRIRITVLSITSPGGLIGLSRGLEEPLNFTPSDFSGYPLVTPLTNLFDDFDPDYDAPLWAAFSGTATANTNGQAAGSGSTGNSLHLDGDGSRYALTSAVDTRAGGSVSFLFAMADGFDSPWESADDGEEVVLEYSIDGEESFVQIGGPYDNRTWQLISVPIPVAARTAETQFRWRQLDNSGSGFDHWALDDVNVSNVILGPEIVVEQPAGNNLSDGGVASMATFVGGFAYLDFTIRNGGGMDLTGLQASIDGSQAGDYAITLDPVSSLAPGESTTFTVRFNPSAVGERLADLHIASNDADENPFDISLVGNGIPAGGGSVSLFANGSYVDTAREALNTRIALADLGYSVVDFTGFSAADWNAAFAADVVVIPELEVAPLVLVPGAISAINAHLAAGKGLVVMGELNSNGQQFLNTLRGWNLATSAVLSSSEPMSKAPGLAGFGNSSELLLALDATVLVDTSTLPGGALPVYQYGTDTAVFVAGQVAYLGYDWWASVDINWGRVLHDAITAVGGEPLPFFTTITQNLGDGTQSNWMTFGSNYMSEADLTTANGMSQDAFDGVGRLTLTPFVALPPLKAFQSTGPLTSSDALSPLRVERQVSLVPGRHATDELITVTNISDSTQSVTMALEDNYGSDSDTQVHRTSSGDATLTTADTWFISNDVTDLTAISGDPTLMVSWSFTSNLPTPLFPETPGAGSGLFNIDFGTFNLAAGETTTVVIRRELFDSAELALANGLPVPPLTPEIAVEQPVGNDLADGSSTASFGAVNVGATSSLEFTVRNTGAANLTGLGITISGANAADFTVTATPAAPIPGGGSTAFSIQFAPGAPGSRSASLQIANNDSNEDPFDIVLTGTGISVGPPPVVHSAPGYRPGAQMVMTVGIDYVGQSLSALGYSLQLPAGWSYVSDNSSAGVKPVAGEIGTIEWAWLSVPASSTAFSVTLLAPPSASGDQLFSAVATLANLQGIQSQITAAPNPLTVPRLSFHTVDVNSNYRYELTELLSVISLYNYRDGTIRTGEFYRDGSVYRPGPGIQTTPYHSTDLDVNWQIGLSELLSDISLYNYRDGTVRTGEYHHDATLGRFVPGPAPSGTATKGMVAISSVDLNGTLSNLSGPLDDAGGVASLQVSLDFNKAQTSSLGVEFTLPPGWSMASETSGTALVRPDPGQTGELAWAWSNIPNSPVEFVVMVNYPAATSPAVISGSAIAGDSSGNQTQDALSVEIGFDPYQLWADTAFDGAPVGVDTSFGGDPDYDGFSNLLEYALGTDPLSQTDERPMLTFNASGQARLSLPKGAIAGLDPRIQYVIEASTNLKDWSIVGVVERENSASTITADYTLSAESVFLRLSVTLDP